MNVIQFCSMLLQKAAILILHCMSLMMFILFFYVPDNGLFI